MPKYKQATEFTYSITELSEGTIDFPAIACQNDMCKGIF